MPSKGRKMAVAICGASLGLFGLGGSAWADVAASTGGSTSSATTPTAPGAFSTRDASHYGMLDHELSDMFVSGLPFTLPSTGTTTATGTTTMTGTQTVNPEETHEATPAQNKEQESESRTTTAPNAAPPATNTDSISNTDTSSRSDDAATRSGDDSTTRSSDYSTPSANPDTTRSDSPDTQSRPSDSQSGTGDSNTSDGQWAGH